MNQLMKTIPARRSFLNLIVSALVLLFVCPAMAQPPAGEKRLDEVLMLVNNLPQMARYKTFKTELEQTITTLGNTPAVGVADRARLKTAYARTKAAYDAVFDKMNADLVDFKTIRKMRTEPEKFAVGYLAYYDSANSVYEQQLKPEINNIQAKLSYKPIPPILIEVGIESIRLIVKYFSDRGEAKEESRKYLQDMIGKMFVEPMKMKSWEGLVTYRPPLPQESAQLSDKGQAPETNLRVGLPTAGTDLEGSLELLSWDNVTKTKKGAGMKVSATKNLEVQSLENDSSTYTSKTWHVTTEQPLKAKDAFQVKVISGCYVYVFALNNTAEGSKRYSYPIYPFFPAKNLTVGDAPGMEDLPSPLMNRNADGSFVIPRTPAGSTEKFIVIDGKSAQEEMAIVFSRSELDMMDLMRRIDYAGGTLEERLARVFMGQALSPAQAGIQPAAGGGVGFKAVSATDNAVVVFPVRITVSK